MKIIRKCAPSFAFLCSCALIPSHSYAQSLCLSLQPCIEQHIPDFDDGLSSAQTVTKAVMSSSCTQETSDCIKEIRDETIKAATSDFEKDGVPFLANGLEEELSSPSNVEKYHDDLVEKYTPLVLRYRVLQKKILDEGENVK